MLFQLAFVYVGVCILGVSGAAVTVCVPYLAEHTCYHSLNSLLCVYWLQLLCMCCVHFDLLVLCTVAAWIAALVQLGRTGQQASCHTLTSASSLDSLAHPQVSLISHSACRLVFHPDSRGMRLCLAYVCLDGVWFCAV